MRKYKRRMLISILALLIIGITVGYAILTSNLNLGGVTTIASNAWDIHFENLEKTTGSVVATKEAEIDEEKTSIYFEVPFEKPGDFYEFKVDIVNAGKIDAKLDDIIKTNLTAEQQNLINYTVRYDGSRALAIGDLLSANSRQKIIVRAEYKTSATDAVMEDIVLNLNIDLKYVQDDGTAVEIPTARNLYQMIANNAVRDDIKSDYVTGEYGIDFSKISSDTNGKGIYTFTKEMDGLYPIYYYRGDVINNNVLFANFCWKIVRTTENGGVKLIYNGVPTDGTCNNTGTASQLAKNSTFNLRISNENVSLAYLGYKYGKAYTPIKRNATESITFGNDVTWDGTKYILKDIISTSDFSKMVNGHHYTCWSSTTTCTTVSYIYVVSSNYYFYSIHLTDGKKVEDALNEMLTESTDENDSIIKGVIDTWYNENITTKSANLEDTIWCNDRRIGKLNGWSKDGDATVGISFAGNVRASETFQPSLTCSTNDMFNVANGKMSTKAGLITMDEIMLAGGRYGTQNSRYYLYTGSPFWSLSPFMAFSIFNVDVVGDLEGSRHSGESGVRPMIALVHDTNISGGNGTVTSPYTIEEK